MRTLAMAAALAAAIVAGAHLRADGASAGQAAAQNAPGPAAATPRMANGKPDMSGMWTGQERGGRGGRNNTDPEILQQIGSRRCAPGQHVDGLPKGRCVNQTLDQEFVREDVIDGKVVFSGRWDANKPLYKPEFWDRIQDLDQHTNTEDPILKCQPQGITRTGMPERIVQLPNEIILFYAGNATQPRDFRMIPTDGRMHTKADLEAVTYWGRSVGRWEADTLMIDSVGFNDLTWLARGGLFHSEKLHIVERFRREGNVLHYAVTVEDPEVLLEPWVLPESQISLNANPNAGFIAETEPCSDYEAGELAAGSHIRH